MKRNNHWNTLWTLPIVALKAITAAQRGNGKLPPSLVQGISGLLAQTNNTASKWSLPNTFWIPNSKGSGTLAGLGCTNGSRQKKKNIIPNSTPIACHSCLHWPLFPCAVPGASARATASFTSSITNLPKSNVVFLPIWRSQNTNNSHKTHIKNIFKNNNLPFDANVNAYGTELD